MSKEKSKKHTEQKKKIKVVKEQDVIKESDYEDNNDNKKIIIVALILALLIGGFAYIRSLDENKKNDKDETEDVVEEENDDEDSSPVVNETVTNEVTNNYQTSTTPSTNEVVNIWADLENISTMVEAGTILALPEIKTTDNGEEVTAVITYQYKANEEDEYTAVSELDTTKLGKYLITYTLSYKDGKVEVKEVEVTISDTVEPIINNISDGDYFNTDVTLDITEYSSYTVMLNGVEYDESTPITTDGEYTLVVTENTESGRSTIVTFTIDKTAPVINGVENNASYNMPVVIEVVDTNINTMVLTKDGEEVSFANGITNIEEDGIYQITATDKAGNSVTYSFVIDTVLPTVSVSYTPDNSELTNSSVMVTITADEEIREIEGWTLSEDKLTLTKEFTENAVYNLEVKDKAGNIVNTKVVVDYIDYNVSYAPKLTLENLVANKVKATITSLKQLNLDETWVEVIEGDIYKYEKIYSESGCEIVSYEDVDGNPGTIEVNIDIELNNLFVTYDQNEITQNVKAYVLTEEEVTNVPEGWLQDDEFMGTGYRYYKEYTENVEYEMVEFITDSKTYVATIVIDSIDREAPIAEADVTYVEENDEKTNVVIVVSANEEINEVTGWNLSEDKKSILKIVDRPATVPTEEQKETVTVVDLKGNETTIEYSYNWNE